MSKKAKILIVDDHPAMRHGLAQLISNEADFEVAGETGDWQETLTFLKGNRPDLVVLDIALKDPDYNGLDLIPKIHSTVGSIPILIYSMHDEGLYAERALHAGARGYLMKQEPVRQIIFAIRRILNDGVYVSDAFNSKLLLRHVGPNQDPRTPDFPEDSLSEREMDVFRLIGKGMQPREIAQKLFLSTKTVETHRMNLRKKLGMTNAAELTRFAVEWVHLRR